MLTTWGPVTLFDRVMDDVMRGSVEASTSSRQFSPAVDVRVDEDKFTFSFDVPGVRKEDLEIVVDKGVLLVKGVRKFEPAAEKQKVVVGRSFGTFARSFALPDDADGDKLTAQLDAGVLTVSVQKQPKAKPRKIEIS